MKRKEQEIAVENTLYTDYRAEFIAAFLIENGLNEESIRIAREGISKVGKNISSVQWEHSCDKFTEYLTIYTRRRNLYESLPEGLFHKRMDIDEKKSKEAVIDSFKHGRQVELSASFFFKPFEMSIDRMLILANLLELQVDKKNKHPNFIRLFSSYWPLFRSLPLNKALLIISFISQSYRLNQTHQIAELLSDFFDCEVLIQLKHKQISLQSDFHWYLGDEKLGCSSVIGESVESECPILEVNINGLDVKYRNLLFRESSEYKQLIQILELFVPADTEINIKIGPAKKGASFSLSKDASQLPILGLSTILL